MNARRLFAVVGCFTIVLGVAGWLANWPEAATLWVGGWLLFGLAARH